MRSVLTLLITAAFLASGASLSADIVEKDQKKTEVQVSKPETTENDEVKLVASVQPEEGWMKNGWGSILYSITNKTDKTLTFQRNITRIAVQGEDPEHKFDEPIKIKIAPGETKRHTQVSWMKPGVAQSVKNHPPRAFGKLTYEIEGMEGEIEYEVDIPVAVLPEPLVRVEGKYIALNLMESSWEGIDNAKEIVAWLDDCYLAMADLTGYRPYDGKIITLEESPRNFAWAYAGNPIVLNTSFVRESVVEFNEGTISFGWVHEIGHDFDFGGWYIFSGPMAECMANFKLSYAYEKLVKEDSKYKARLWGHYPYKQNGENPHVTGLQFNNSYFLNRLTYLGDHERDWKSLKSDDLHCFNSQLVRKYGWELYKNWYRAYVELGKQEGLERPETPEDKINLSCAILSQITGDDLIPTFQLWRFPVTSESVAEINKRYPIHQVAQPLSGDTFGMWTHPLPPQPQQ